jgi:hypothetical protein
LALQRYEIFLDEFLYFISLEVFVKVAEIVSYTVHDSGFHHKVAENCPLMDYYAASIGNSLPMFWDNILALDFLPLKMGPIGFPETLVMKCHYSLRNSPEDHSSVLVLFFFLHKLAVRLYV